ncbi:MAG: VCBS repeat-containing protein [Sandaracinaceae bacterium]|nr:VCBS repeat-containing protein [Sandaracinaceae bacterium]
MRRASPWLLVLSVCSLHTSVAVADWPMARHDRRRTSVGDGTARIERPALAFRHYLGGTLGREQYLATDTDGDGTPEIVFVMGGALIAKSADDIAAWETEALDIYRIDGLEDLDGDGTPELVASARAGKVHVIQVRDGAVLWSLPGGVVGNVGNVRFADFDLDGVTDLYLADAACGSTGSLGDIGRVHRFAAGFASPTMLLELERGRRDYVCGGNDTLVDLDGDMRPEIVAQGVTHFYVYAGTDGHLVSTSPDIGSIPYGQATTRLVDVDGDGRLELVCFTENNYAPPVNSRRVFLMAWDETAGQLVRRWERAVTDPLNDRHGWFPGGVEDLEDDGTYEVVTSFYDAAASRWTTYVLDAASGNVRASVTRGPFRGLVDLTGDGSSEVLVGDTDAGLGAFRYAAGALTRLFLAPSTEPLIVRDDARRSSASARALGVDIDHDGTNELMALRAETDGSHSLVALAPASDPPAERARLAVGGDVTLLAFETFTGVTRAYPQILLARSDGYLWILDDRLAPTNVDSTSTEFPQRGLRIGGFYSGPNGIGAVPIAADLDGDGAAEILARDSRGVLQRIGASSATLVEPPTVDWEVARALLPIAVDLDGDGTPEVVTGVDAATDQIRALRASDGTELWRTTVGTMSAGLTGDLVAGPLSGDATPDIVYELSDSSGGTVRINVLDGATGTRRWASDFVTVVAGSGLGTNALGDRDGDGTLEVLATPRNLFMWLSGSDGTSLANAAAGYPGHGVIADVDPSPGEELLTSGAVYGVTAMRRDLTSLWSTGTTSLHTRVLGALANCSGEQRYLQAHFNSARITVWRASDGSVLGDVALRGGRIYEPPSAVPDAPGILGDVTVSPDLIGRGHPTALVPSTDGHLYAIDACTLALEWAMDFRFPVGEAILADTNGDGEDEAIVTVADGYLYGIARERIPAPAWVRENDGGGPALTDADDVDELITSDTLYANWEAVPRATSYEYAVITPGGAFLTRPSFVAAGSATSVTATGLPLRAGQRFLFAVRAIGADGASSETLSDGVVVRPDPCAACQINQICVDHVCVPDPCSGIMCPAGTRCEGGSCVATGDAGVGADGGTTPRPDGGPATTTAGGCCAITPGASTGPSGVPALLVLALAVLRRRARPRR